MRRNGYSRAYRDFELSLKRAKTLRKLENKLYKDPPSPQDTLAVEALRGGAAILMVASLERYLKDALEEFVDLVEKVALSTSHTKVPLKLIEYNDLNFLSWVFRENRFSRSQKLAEVKRIAVLIAGSKFIPESFSRTRSNPGSSTIGDLFKEFGIADPFTKIDEIFQTYPGEILAGGTLAPRIDSIVSRRNEIAHGGYSLSISRDDLDRDINFLARFGRSADNCLRNYTLTLISQLK